MLNNKITDWGVVTTNTANIVLHPTTCDDLIDIIKQIKKISRVDTIYTLLTLFDEHVQGYKVKDPHNTQLDTLVGSILDRFYHIWLTRDNSESLDSFRELIFSFYKYGSELDIFNAVNDDRAVIVKHFSNYFEKYHNLKLNVYGQTHGIFQVSQKSLQWNGESHGFQLIKDPTTNENVLDLVSVENTPIDDIWYRCQVEVSLKFSHANITAYVVSNLPVTIKYKDSAATEWNILNSAVEVNTYQILQEDGTIVDLLDYQSYLYHLPTELENLLGSPVTIDEIQKRTIDILFEPRDPITTTQLQVKDFIVTVDGSKHLTDDPTKQKIYSDYPHRPILKDIYDFTASLSKYRITHHSSYAFYDPTEVFTLSSNRGTICTRFQGFRCNYVSLKDGKLVFKKVARIPIFTFLDNNKNSKGRLELCIRGDRVHDSQVGFSTNTYASIQECYLEYINNENESIPLIDLSTSLRAIFGVVIQYRRYHGCICTILTQDGYVSNSLDTDILTEDVSVSVDIARMDHGTSISMVHVQDLSIYADILDENAVYTYLSDYYDTYPYLPKKLSIVDDPSMKTFGLNLDTDQISGFSTVSAFKS